MYKMSLTVNIHNASDKSGVLFFVPELGQTIILEFELGKSLVKCASTGSFSKELLCSKLPEKYLAQINEQWEELLSKRILVEVN